MAKPILEGKSIIIGENVQFGHNVVIYNGVRLGNNMKIGNNVVIYPETSIGDYTVIFDNVVLGRLPLATAGIARKVRNKYPPLKIGKECVIGVGVVIYRGTVIEKEVLVGDLAAVREECKIGEGSVVGRGSMLNYNIMIGKRVRIMDTAHFGGDMIIEDDVFISPHVCSANDNYMGITGGKQRKGATIRKGALIGTNATLLADIEIGKYAIIGAGALVNKNIPPRKVAVGVPVRIIKDVSEEFLKGK